MEAKIEGKPAFAHVHFNLAPQEALVTESDAMTSMDTQLTMTPKLNGGFFSALIRKFLGKESLFINTFRNPSTQNQRLTITQATPGDIVQVPMSGEGLYLQPGAYIASTLGVKVTTSWAGFGSFLGGEGLVRLKLEGQGNAWLGAYGAVVSKEIDGDYIVDSGHLLAYSPGITIHAQLSNGIFGSFFSGEGIVMRIKGRGKIYMQTRSLDGLASWLRPAL